MSASNFISFSLSKTGSGHLPNGTPCQDYSLDWTSDDESTRIIVVCDGHGSSTYVRSDRGAKLAAEITRDALIAFSKNHAQTEFLGKFGAVTARETDDSSKWFDIPPVQVDSLTESERARFSQRVTFAKQIETIREEDDIIMSLAKEIVTKWKEAIMVDSLNDPFTDAEKKKLGGNRIEKAYGTTLQAFLLTPFYWMALHIGDGRLLCSDRSLRWKSVVPWDCNCFQNLTTSLCSSKPELSFRYAFDGTGSFPSAVFSCSDGIEDSYGDYEMAPEKLHSFFTGLLNEFLLKGKEATLQKLNDFLPHLSAAGSHDDMSISGIINLDAIAKGLQIQGILSSKRSIEKNRKENILHIENLEKEIQSLKTDIALKNQEMRESNSLLYSIKEQIRKHFHALLDLHNDRVKAVDNINSLTDERNTISAVMESKKQELYESREQSKTQLADSREEMKRLKQQYDMLEKEIFEEEKLFIEDWNQRVLKQTDK